MIQIPTRLQTLLTSGRRSDMLSAEDLKQMRITGTIEYLAGAVTLTMVTLLPDPDPTDHVPYLTLALIGVLLAALRYTAPQRVSVIRASILIGFVYIAAIITVARPIGPTPFFFLWPMLTTAYFLGRRDLIAVSAAFAAALAIGLAANANHAFGAQMFMPTFSVVVIVSGLVLALRERVDRLMHDLEYTASTDMLTGLANRRTFELACNREIERAGRSRTPLALAIFDLDHFKLINDRLGHAEGDRALRRFADILSAESRIVDVPARIGGEEFALVLSNCDAEGARIFAERLIERLALITRHDPAPLSVSVGITELADATDTQDVLLLTADRALYEAKNTGRSKAVVARSAPAERALHTGTRVELSHAAPMQAVSAMQPMRAAGASSDHGPIFS